ncbi:hypothetical protein LTS18_005678, partial [Coniosporium uncinatum]
SRLNVFFIKARERQRRPNPETTARPEEEQLLEEFKTKQHEFSEALADNFNTPLAVQTISELINRYNVVERDGPVTDATILSIAIWITEMVTMFGLDNAQASTQEGAAHIGWSGIEIPAYAAEHVYALSALRDGVRTAARVKPFSVDPIKGVLGQTQAPAYTQDAASLPFAEALSQTLEDLRDLVAKNAGADEFLRLTDLVRNQRLWDLGIFLEDSVRASEPALVRPVDAQDRADRAEREASATRKAGEKAAKDAEKAKRLAEEEEKKRLRAEKDKIPPEEMFRDLSLYSEWDDKGFPVRDREGKELSKSAVKKVQKLWGAQEKAHEAWKKAQEGA